MNVSRVQAVVVLLISLSLFVRAASGQKPQNEADKITVTTVQSKAVPITRHYVCRIHALQHIEVRAPSEGYVSEILIGEGQAVKKGDVIGKISPVLYQARLDAEKAERDITQLEFNNTKRLYANRTVSELEMKLYEAKLAKAQAKVNLEQSEVNLTTLQAPFDGVVGRLVRQSGSFVLKGETLTTLTDNGQMRVDFNVPEALCLDYLTETAKNQHDSEVELLLANGSKFPEHGKRRDRGGVQRRKRHVPRGFPNPHHLLRQGQTGTVVFRQVQDDAVVVPQRATFEVHNKRYVYVVDKDHVAHQREIVIQSESDDLFVIKKGVDAGDKFVLDGVKRVHDGDKVESEDR